MKNIYFHYRFQCTNSRCFESEFVVCGLKKKQKKKNNNKQTKLKLVEMCDTDYLCKYYHPLSLN